MRTLESIKQGLKQRALTKFQNHNATLDREKELFLNWMALEFHQLYTAVNKSKDSIEKNIFKKLTSEMSTRPQPVHAIAHANAKKNDLILYPGEHLFTIDRFANKPPYEIYFSPLKPSILVNAKIKWTCFRNTLSEHHEGGVKIGKAKTQNGQSLHAGMQWLGIELKNKDQLPKKLSFHFDWGNDTQKEKAVQLLPLIKWKTDNQELSTTLGIAPIFSTEKGVSNRTMDQEMLHLKTIEKRICKSYKDAFVTIENEEAFHSTELPAALNNIFSEETTQTLNEGNILWVQVLFPSGFRPEWIRNCQIRLNCFPVINRKLDKSKDFNPSHFGGQEICALSNGDKRRTDLSHSADFFLGIERIFSNKINYRSTSFESFSEVPTGYYSLQQGRVEADDFRDTLCRAEELVQILKRHHGQLLQVSEHNVQSALHNIESGCQELETALNHTPPQAIDAGHYLHLKAHDPQDMIYIEFWLTQGDAAKDVLSGGDFLSTQKTGSLESDGIWII